MPSRKSKDKEVQPAQAEHADDSPLHSEGENDPITFLPVSPLTERSYGNPVFKEKEADRGGDFAESSNVFRGMTERLELAFKEQNQAMRRLVESQAESSRRQEETIRQCMKDLKWVFEESTKPRLEVPPPVVEIPRQIQEAPIPALWGKGNQPHPNIQLQNFFMGEGQRQHEPKEVAALVADHDYQPQHKYISPSRRGNNQPAQLFNRDQLIDLVQETYGPALRPLVCLAYKKPYPDVIDHENPFPRGFKVPEFTLFSGEPLLGTLICLKIQYSLGGKWRTCFILNFIIVNQKCLWQTCRGFFKLAQNGLNIERRKKFEGMEFRDFYELSYKVARYENLLKEDVQKKAASHRTYYSDRNFDLDMAEVVTDKPVVVQTLSNQLTNLRQKIDKGILKYPDKAKETMGVDADPFPAVSVGVNFADLRSLARNRSLPYAQRNLVAEDLTWVIEAQRSRHSKSVRSDRQRLKGQGRIIVTRNFSPKGAKHHSTGTRSPRMVKPPLRSPFRRWEKVNHLKFPTKNPRTLGTNCNAKGLKSRKGNRSRWRLRVVHLADHANLPKGTWLLTLPLVFQAKKEEEPIVCEFPKQTEEEAIIVPAQDDEEEDMTDKIVFEKPEEKMVRHIRLLYINAHMEGTPINHVLVDNGVAVNVLPTCMLYKIGKSLDDLVHIEVTISDFIGGVNRLRGVLPVELTMENKTLMSAFFVVDTVITYNALLGHDWIHSSWSEIVHEGEEADQGDEITLEELDLAPAKLDDLKVEVQDPLEEINLGSEKGFRLYKQRPKRMSAEVTLKVKEEIERLVKAGFIWIGRYAEWLSNVVPVLKKNGKLGVYVDFQNLNLATPKDEYPMPIADLLIDEVARHKILSFMDGHSGAMNAIFHDMIGKFMEIYIDDVVVKSHGEEDHLVHLRKAFERMRQHGLKMNPLKCAFGVSASNFLGYLVHECGLEVDKKSKAMIEAKPPQNKKELQRFLGQVNFLKRFISNLAGKTRVFSPLLKLKYELDFDCTDNQAEYETLIIGLEMLVELKVSMVEFIEDSQLVLKQLSGWAINLIGKVYPPSSKGHSFIIVAMDYFIKWVEAKPMKKVDQSDVIKFIKEDIIHRFGLSETITTNQGIVFVSHQVEAFAKKMSFRLLNFPPHYAQANGQAEASNKVVINLLEKMVDDNPRRWHELLSKTMWAYRTSQKSSTKMTTFALTYGHDTILPMKLTARSLRIAIQHNLQSGEYDEAMMLKLEELEDTRLTALDRLQAQKLKIAKSYNKRVKGKNLIVGDLV
ncbi:hypothetical protein SLEP1_g49174 [Rubroshorea leprosula]|uniref:Integrase catalytic domain-containing protein n=1 Tax=Rubroshorea leprosula TaxID=152421 RepID=A0AAV5LW05_9ROSI|nr:hypothetical protein SLEP1_g49174 [Rubroshorea leprosula]